MGMHPKIPPTSPKTNTRYSPLLQGAYIYLNFKYEPRNYSDEEVIRTLTYILKDIYPE